MGYGTGAIMAVPGQDERDWEFAEKFDLPIIRTVQPHRRARRTTSRSSATASRSTAPTSEVSLDGLRRRARPRRKIIEFLDAEGHRRGHDQLQAARLAVQPPALLGRAVPDHVRRGRRGVCRARRRAARDAARRAGLQPEDVRPRRRAEQPGAAAQRVAEWVRGREGLGDGRGLRKFRRETNTMPNWAGSCWYYLRYLDPANHDAFVDPANEAYWLGRHADAGRRRPGGHARPGRRRPLRRRRRARGAAPALRPLLAQGALRPRPRQQRGAVPEVLLQGYIQAYAYTDSRGQYVTRPRSRSTPAATARSRRSRGRGSRSSASTARSASR